MHQRPMSQHANESRCRPLLRGPAARSALVSLLVHAAMLLTLALISLGIGMREASHRCIVFENQAVEQPLFTVDLGNSADAVDDARLHAGADTFDGMHAAVDRPTIEIHDAVRALDAAAGIQPPAMPLAASPEARMLLQEVRPSWTTRPAAARTAGEGVAAVVGTAEAANAVVSQLRRDLAEGPLFIVWLLDASLSLEDDRRQLARSLEPFYRDCEGSGNDQPQVMSAVVAYGHTTHVAQDTSRFHAKSLNTIQNIPFDQTGVENVMAAVGEAVARFGPRAKGRLRIVVWTDESGDDTSLLEETIALCGKFAAVVHVVGPSSVLGTDRGLQPYTDKATGYSFLLPVKRGPDTCFQERLLLPYWFDATAAHGMFNGLMVADGMPWYGGPLRERLMSGTGPYSLTRLALQTGGSYTILDRPGEVTRFPLEAMKEYFPDYGSAQEIFTALKRSRLRSAIMHAVQTTYKPVQLSTPRMRFPVFRDDSYPFREHIAYLPPGAFRPQLAAVLAEQAALVQSSARVIEEALAAFGDEDWEALYAEESSRRWRAWYDLTHGRLLMMSIRHQEYLARCKWVLQTGNLAPQTNFIAFLPGDEMLASSPHAAARKLLGTKLLDRCVASNPETPWAMLAAWEMAAPLGVGAWQDVVPQPPPPTAALKPVQRPPVFQVPKL